LDRKLTLVSAPAGYGKTSALVDFAQRSSVPVCWYTADDRDRDVGTFVAYLVGAIGERFPGFGEQTRGALDSLAGDLSRDPTGVVGELVNEMLEIDSPFAVVVDNYDVVDGGYGIRPFVHRLLEVLPPNCHLMLDGRVLPDVPVARLVAKRQLVGLAAEDLRFETGEIRELLELSQIEATEAQIEAIAANSEGWITGVLLLADLVREEAEVALLDEERATAEAYDYLAGEVLSRQLPDVQRFLCTSAVLREMSSRLCREVLGIERPRPLLAEVERRNLFVTRFGSGGGAVYRYHNLFRDFLHERLWRDEPERCADLHLRAAKRFERDDDVEETVHHYLAAGAFAEGMAVMERVAMEWFTRGRVDVLVNWAQALPAKVKAEAPRVSLYQSKVLTDRYDYEGARHALAQAEVGFATRDDRAWLAMVHNQRATLAMLEDRHEDVIAQAQKALEILGDDRAVERAEAQRLIGRANIGLGRFVEGIAQLQDALTLYRDVGSPYGVVNLLQDLGVALVELGRFDQAGECLTEALAMGRRLGAPMLLAGVLNDLGWLNYLWGRYGQALALYDEGLAAAQRGGDLRYQAYLSTGIGDLYRDVGLYDRAVPLYDAGWQIAQEREPGLAVYVLAARADMYRWQGDGTRALAVLRQARKLADEKGLDFESGGLLPAAEGIALAEIGDVEAGASLLSDAAGFLERRQAKRDLARAQFLLAKAHFLAGDEPRAVAALHRTMDLADEIGTDQFVVVEGQHAEGLLRLGAAEGVASCNGIIERIQELTAFSEGRLRIDEECAPDDLEIHALGAGRVIRDGQEIPSSEWQAAMVKELFFYILMHGPVERDAIGVVFWPDLSTKKMSNSFHTTLHRMRGAVGADAVVLEEGRYRLGDVGYWFDVQEFEALVVRARLLPPQGWQVEGLWRRAAALYRGDFLPEVDRAWCMPKREALRKMYLEALVGVGRCCEARSDFDGAVEWYDRALAADELREDVHGRIMRCYAEAGRRSEALAQYERCREVLDRELGMEPAVEIRDLYERIRGKRPG
jgi:ATP/maltotriose-dependent transcriptional regulator MalT/DNA-binding SARP family transcriptional activator